MDPMAEADVAIETTDIVLRAQWLLRAIGLCRLCLTFISFPGSKSS